MKIIKQGDVRIFSIEQNKQSYPDILKAYRIFTFSEAEASLGGDQKIQIFLRDKEKPENPTIISTGDNWTAFDQDDAIKILTKNTFNEIVIVYFNLKHMEFTYQNL